VVQVHCHRMRKGLVAATLAIAYAAAHSQPTPTPPALERGSTWHSWYGEKLAACIRPHLSFHTPEGTSEQLYSEFKVTLRPDAHQATPPMLLVSSGLPGFDDAAMKAITACDPFPTLWDGTVPPEFWVRMYPVWP
jgi:hypothetical protein